jgi:hypothetical protein
MNKLCSIAKDSSSKNGYSKKDIQELKEKIYTGIDLAVERSD